VPGQGEINWPVFFETLNLIGFDGFIGLDIGGAESEVGNIDRAYIQSANWLTEHWRKTRPGK
jgi:sugar phosphate isomerase/epimerase